MSLVLNLLSYPQLFPMYILFVFLIVKLLSEIPIIKWYLPDTANWLMSLMGIGIIVSQIYYMRRLIMVAEAGWFQTLLNFFGWK